MNNLSFNLGNAYQAPIRAGDTGPLIGNFISVSLVTSGIILVFVFIVSGIGIIRGAGNSNPEQAAKSKKALTYAITGFAVVFFSYWIIRLIEVIAGTNFITQPSI